MGRVEKLVFAGNEVTLDPEKLRFDEMSLSTYITEEGSIYDNLGGYLALSEKNLQNHEVLCDRLVSERFVEAKENGASDKLAEAKAKCDQDVVTKRLEITEAKYVVNRLKNHLKAWDKNHDNAQSLGHMLRKQMDKLGGDIYHTGQRSYAEIAGIDTPPSKSESASSGPGGFEELSMDNLY